MSEYFIGIGFPIKIDNLRALDCINWTKICHVIIKYVHIWYVRSILVRIFYRNRIADEKYIIMESWIKIKKVIEFQKMLHKRDWNSRPWDSETFER